MLNVFGPNVGTVSTFPFRIPQAADLYGPTAPNGKDTEKSPLHRSTSTSMNASG